MRKSKEQQEMAGLLIPKSQKKHLQKAAKDKGISFTELLVEGGELMAGFDVGFVKQLTDIAEKIHLDLAKVITHLLLTYVATDSANLKVWGRSKTYARAFQYNVSGMLTGSELANKVFDDALKDAENLKKKLEDSRDGRAETLFISPQDAADLALIVPGVDENKQKQGSLWA